jgi:iron complex transport system ATP-binding protein
MQADQLYAGYENNIVLHGLDLQVGRGELTAVLGANGSGKSTLLKVLSRNLKPFSGTVNLNGASILAVDGRSVARQLAFVPQTPRAPEDFTVRDLIGYGRFPHLGWTGSMRQRDWEVVEEAAAATRVLHLQHRALHTLSGGERQRAFLAMALAQQTRVMLLDEPTTFLDICHQFETLELIRRLNRDLGVTIVMVMHDINQAARYAKRIALLYGGRVMTAGSPEKVLTETNLEKAFRIKGRVCADPVHGCPLFVPGGSVDGPDPGIQGMVETQEVST